MLGDTVVGDEGMYSQAQLKILFWVSYPPLLLTCFGSATILYIIIFKEWRKPESATSNNPQRTYNRIMIGLSTSDLTAGVGGLVFKNWTVPAESGLAYGAVGNTLTCSINGFFTNFLIGSMLYTACLAVYFVLKVRFEVHENVISKYYEPFFHAIPIVVTLTSGVVGIFLEAFNPFDELAGFCWISDYPPGCSRPHRDDLECLRGQDSYVLAKMLASGTIAITLLTIITCMVLIVAHVWTTEKRMQRFNHAGISIHSTKVTQETAIQALLYIGFFFLSTVGLIVIQLSPKQESRETASYYFPLSLVTEILSPMQGFFNAIIYIRPRFRELTADSTIPSDWAFYRNASAALSWAATRASNHVSDWTKRGRKKSFDTDEDLEQPSSPRSLKEESEDFPDSIESFYE